MRDVPTPVFQLHCTFGHLKNHTNRVLDIQAKIWQLISDFRYLSYHHFSLSTTQIMWLSMRLLWQWWEVDGNSRLLTTSLFLLFRSFTISHDWSAAFHLVTSMWWICQTDLWHWSTEATESPRFKRVGEEFYLNLWPQYIYKLKSFILANTNLPLSKNNFTLILIAITFIPDPTTPVVRMNLYQRESRYNRIEPRFTSLPFFDTWRLPYRNWKRI